MPNLTLIQNIFFIDIETVPMTPDYDSLPESFKYLWDKRSRSLRNEDESPDEVYHKAGIYAEFGKIICISMGYLTPGPDRKFRVKSFYNNDEKLLLDDFHKTLTKLELQKEIIFCGHNLKDFDLAFISRRLLINGFHLPDSLLLSGKKPWEIKHIDTMELWKFGDFRHNVSLELLSLLFNIPTPKDDIDGSQVANVYYQDQDLPRIVKYCEKDVVAVAQLYLKLNARPAFDMNMVESVTLF